MARIVVVGSINMDLVTQAPRFPGPGETILGEHFLTVPGGKGANQAVASARLGAEVALVGATGRDAFGQQLRRGLETEGIELSHVLELDDCASGTASITVAGGENQIVVVPAANARVTPAQVERAAARLGAAVALVGALGRDAFGDQLHAGLRQEGVDLAHVHRLADEASGTASIAVAGGENQIVVVPAANAGVTPAHVEAAREVVAHADVVLVQMEIPLDAIEATLRLGHRLGVPVILNPAPAQPLPAEWLRLARYVTPNQHELAIVLGADPAEADFLALMQRTPCPVVLTRGAEGAWYREQGPAIHQPGFPVTVVDSTGAGDTFNGALAVFLHEGAASAVRKGCAAAALSVGKLGAQNGMPRRLELEAMLARAPIAG